MILGDKKEAFLADKKKVFEGLRRGYGKFGFDDGMGVLVEVQ